MSKEYTIIICVKNTFDASTNVGIKVKVYTGGKEKGKSEPNDYTINAGTCHPFLLNNTDEYLEISRDQKKEMPTTYPYEITAGKKAKAKCEFDDEPVEPEIPLIGAEYHEDGFYAGGTWTVEEEDKDKIWTLTIKEYEPDPQTDDVVIGPPPPQG